MSKTVILASSSPIRRQLLVNAGIPVEQRPHRIDERDVERSARRDGVPVGGMALALALAKAASVARTVTDQVVIAADQTLVIEGETLAKPRDRLEARGQLARLSGRTHELHSAFAVADGGRIVGGDKRVARLHMRQLDDIAIDRYLDAAGEVVLGSVGAYQIEGLGIRLFDRIAGDTFTVLGLPMLPLLRILRRIGAIDP